MNKKIKSGLAILLASCILCLCACDKEEAEPLYKPKGSAQCLINGEQWEGKFNSAGYYGNATDKISISLRGYRTISKNEFIPWGVIGIQSVRKNLSKQTIENAPNTLPLDTSKVDGLLYMPLNNFDVLCDSYGIIESDSIYNWVQITRQEDDYKKVWGSFSMNMIRTKTCDGSQMPDTLIIRNGTFYVEIEE